MEDRPSLTGRTFCTTCQGMGYSKDESCTGVYEPGKPYVPRMCRHAREAIMAPRPLAKTGGIVDSETFIDKDEPLPTPDPAPAVEPDRWEGKARPFWDPKPDEGGKT